MKSNFLLIQNSDSFDSHLIPVIDTDTWRQSIINICREEGRIVALFGEKNSNKIYAVVGIDSKSELLISSTVVKDKKYQSLTNELTEAHLFERELFEQYEILPEGHPYLKPVRNTAGHNYYSIDGDDIHEVAVGPVHAGVIEPGHFRFQCHGEKVLNLEIHLGYQHRGVENLILESNPLQRLILSESIAGDTVIGHSLAYSHVIEGLCDSNVTQKARLIRGIALELERIANHIGDLGALSNDVGFLPAASYFGALRADFLNMLMLISGNRFGRGLIKPGGVSFYIEPEMIAELKRRLEGAGRKSSELCDLLLSTPSVLARFERTGIVKPEVAKEIGLVGVSARASNMQRDVRRQYPCGVYKFKQILSVKVATGDVYARARVRALEIKRSIEFIGDLLNSLPQDKIFLELDNLKPGAFVVSQIEGWRGEIVHIGSTDENGRLINYKIIDPSFHNWSGLEMAMRGGQISDFPLCNKSFNLSYAGYDL